MNNLDLAGIEMIAPSRITKTGIAYLQIGSGDSLLLLHGGGGSWTHWIRNIGVLAESRTVYALDLPGFGQSRDVPSDISMDAYVTTVMSAALETCGTDAALDIVGFSFGGFVAAGVAAALGNRARRLSMIGPAGFEPPVGRVLGRRRPKDVERINRPDNAEALRELHRHNLRAFMLADPASVDDEAIAIQADNQIHAQFNNRQLSWSGKLLKFLESVQCPVQLIYGDRDKTAFPSVEARVSRCRAVIHSLRVDIIANAGHWAQYERADEVNRVLIDFLGAAK
jgi:2-hydroxy-6-oxonona-2,4-dienedioate hydrolase